MGHPPWGSSMGFSLSTSEMGSIGPRVHSIRTVNMIHVYVHAHVHVRVHVSPTPST